LFPELILTPTKVWMKTKIPGKSVGIVDDVLAQGNTLMALIDILEEARCKIFGISVIALGSEGQKFVDGCKYRKIIYSAI